MALPIVKIRGVSKSFGQKLVLDNVNLDIVEGEIFGIIGASGAGKTTLLECMVGFLPISKGEIAHKANDSTTTTYIPIMHNLKEFNKQIGFSTQDPSFYDKLTVQENLEYFAKLYDLPKEIIAQRVRKILELVELTGDEKTVADNLSGGMQKRLDIACALINDPKILILDEPTADLDPVLRKHIWQLVKKINAEGKTIIVSSHFLEEIEDLCTRIAIIANKTIALVGTTDDLRKQYPYEKEIFLQLASQQYEKLAAQMRGLPIAKMTVRGPKMVIYAQNANVVLKKLISVLENQKDDIIELDVQKPTLDEVFANILRGNK